MTAASSSSRGLAADDGSNDVPKGVGTLAGVGLTTAPGTGVAPVFLKRPFM